jgi:hypothetical protein
MDKVEIDVEMSQTGLNTILRLMNDTFGADPPVIEVKPARRKANRGYALTYQIPAMVGDRRAEELLQTAIELNKLLPERYASAIWLNGMRTDALERRALEETKDA